ncbi:23S rRNA (adenine(2030)-N(6))-methyltransferase RlmJ [Roseivivax isoporae]|uniref:Ribosomal RNA large subunit methyltransferase J n=1 Tax=Roseivivax isoporae LMG 25204 TaxID=1449351 RepID=X7FBH2_9RHOB|nr:23S rRNA (adenine(2030)-N(6))-methyltransferase RlmJ [Roseivivax isoporae]ETX30043.1 external DNA catabolism protein [Roseivivax isoporae LMG 25204]
MLSYQHAYHAGNLADVHKHALLSEMLDYLTRKEKPLTYIETHAGRGLYDLSGAASRKTGEAQQGIARALGWFPQDHPYTRVLAQIRARHGRDAYPGSPLIAQALLRPTDRLHLAELHPAEHAALAEAVSGRNVSLQKADGLALALSLAPPEPRRGLLLCDPSWERPADYDEVPKALKRIAKSWNVGILALWYPILSDPRHGTMMADLEAAFPDALRHEVRFPPVREGHRMVGSGMFVTRPPYGLDAAARRLGQAFAGAAG